MYSRASSIVAPIASALSICHLTFSRVGGRNGNRAIGLTGGIWGGGMVLVVTDNRVVWVELLPWHIRLTVGRLVR